MRSGLSIVSAGFIGAAGLVGGASLTRTTAGLLLQDSFASLASWNLFGGSDYTADSSAPAYVLYPHDRVFMDLGSGGSYDAHGLREPMPVRLGDGSLAVFYDSADGTSAWAAAVASSADNGLTITRHGALSLPNPHGYASLCQTGAFEYSGLNYIYALTATTLFEGEAGVPANPYGNALYSTPSLISGPYTLVSNADPALVGGDTNSCYQVFYDSVALEWVMLTACGTDPWKCGKATATSPLGPWTQTDSDLFPAAVEGGSFGGPENTRAWYSATLGIWAATANNVGGTAGSTCGFYYASTFAAFATDGAVRHTCVLWPGAGAANRSVSPGSPIFDLSHNVLEEANGCVGFVYGGDTTGTANYNDQRLRAGQLEPCLHALKVVPSGGSPVYISRDLGVADGVMEFTVEYADLSGNLQFWFNGTSCDGTDAGSNYYLVDLNPSDTHCTLYQNSAGSFTQRAQGSVLQTKVYTPDSLNRWYYNVRVVTVAGVITVHVNGVQQFSYDTGAALTGTLCGFRAYLSAGRFLNFSQRTANTVAITGLTNGDAVSLHGAGKLPAVSGTASGSSLTLTHSHFPLAGIQINGTYYPKSAIWGGDVYELA